MMAVFLMKIKQVRFFIEHKTITVGLRVRNLSKLIKSLTENYKFFSTESDATELIAKQKTQRLATLTKKG